MTLPLFSDLVELDRKKYEATALRIRELTAGIHDDFERLKNLGDGMKCSKCKGETRVKDSKDKKDLSTAVQRKRVCLCCGRVFHTEEREVKH